MHQVLLAGHEDVLCERHIAQRTSNLNGPLAAVIDLIKNDEEINIAIGLSVTPRLGPK